jgi:hypothetical protein
MSDQKRKSVNRTFRVDQLALETIEKDAKDKNVSTNTLVNQLLLAYANFDRYYEQFPMVKIFSSVFRDLLDGVSEDYAKKAGKDLARNLVRAVIVSRRGEVNLSTLLDQFRLVSNYSEIFTFKESEVSGKKILTIYHRFGNKGSLYFGEYLLSLFELIDMQPRLTFTDNSIQATFQS